VAVDVPGRSHREAKVVLPRLAGQGEVGDRVRARAAAVDIGPTGVAATRVVQEGSDDEVGETVTVDVPGRGDRDAEVVARRGAGQGEVGDRVGGGPAVINIGP